MERAFLIAWRRRRRLYSSEKARHVSLHFSLLGNCFCQMFIRFYRLDNKMNSWTHWPPPSSKLSERYEQMQDISNKFIWKLTNNQYFKIELSTNDIVELADASQVNWQTTDWCFDRQQTGDLTENTVALTDDSPAPLVHSRLHLGITSSSEIRAASPARGSILPDVHKIDCFTRPTTLQIASHTTPDSITCVTSNMNEETNWQGQYSNYTCLVHFNRKQTYPVKNQPTCLWHMTDVRIDMWQRFDLTTRNMASAVCIHCMF